VSKQLHSDGANRSVLVDINREASYLFFEFERYDCSNHVKLAKL